MLKSTHRPIFSPSLPPGWTEHKAPTGHSYYYNATTKQSTYARPTAPAQPPVQSLPSQGSQDGFIGLTGLSQGVGRPDFSQSSYQGLGHEHHFYDGPPNQYQPSSHHNSHRGRGNFRGGHGYQDRRSHKPEDRPKTKHAIPGCSPWLLIKTKLGRRFVYNPDTDESFWKFPAEVMKGVVEYDRIEREKKEREGKGDGNLVDDETAVGADVGIVAERGEGVTQSSAIAGEHRAAGEDSDEYEEVEVTDDEDVDEENQSKRQKTDQGESEQPVEFNEDDISYQLAAMGQDYGLDPGEYGDGDGENWDEGVEGIPLTEEDSNALFKDMLDDYGINPYTTWEKVIEEGRIVEDDRYTVLSNMKSRKEVWVQWSRDKIQKLKEQREKEERKDPRIPFLAFLEKNATPKLYWPEFRRKYKKEPEMRDTKLSDKEREKYYREYINRLKLPESTLKSELSTLLKSIPLHQLNRTTSLLDLPIAIRTDMRYISLNPPTREPLMEAYVSTLASAPEATDISPEEEAALAERKEQRERRAKALADREKRVQEEKRRQNGALRYSKGVLREGEEEIERAMKVGREGLKSQLEVDRDQGAEKT